MSFLQNAELFLLVLTGGVDAGMKGYQGRAYDVLSLFLNACRMEEVINRRVPSWLVRLCRCKRDWLDGDVGQTYATRRYAVGQVTKFELPFYSQGKRLFTVTMCREELGLTPPVEWAEIT